MGIFHTAQMRKAVVVFLDCWIGKEEQSVYTRIVLMPNITDGHVNCNV